MEKGETMSVGFFIGLDDKTTQGGEMKMGLPFYAAALLALFGWPFSAGNDVCLDEGINYFFADLLNRPIPSLAIIRW